MQGGHAQGGACAWGWDSEPWFHVSAEWFCANAPWLSVNAARLRVSEVGFCVNAE